MSSLTLGGLITLIVGVIWKLIQLSASNRSAPLPLVRLKAGSVDLPSKLGTPTRGEAFTAWLKIERAMRAQGATPEQIRAAGLACLQHLIVEGRSDEK